MAETTTTTTTTAAKQALGVRFGISGDGATGDVHCYGDIPASLRAVLQETATAHKSQKSQFLPSGDDECLLTKLEIADYFRLEVKVARILAQEGWKHVSTETTPSRAVKTTIHIYIR